MNADNGSHIGPSALHTIESIAALERRFNSEQNRRSRMVVHAIDRVATVGFLAAEVSIILVWLGYNTLAGRNGAFDPAPFSLLGVTLATTGVITTTCLLIKATEQSRRDRERDQLRLHVSLLNEHKMTKLIHLSTLCLERAGMDREEIARELEDLMEAGSIEDTLGALRSRMPVP